MPHSLNDSGDTPANFVMEFDQDRRIETIKWIAIIAMTIDHIGRLCFPEHTFYILTNAIGRFAFPAFCWVLAVRYAVSYAVHSRPIYTYTKRLLIMWAISAPVSFTLDLPALNILFVLAVGLLFLDCYVLGRHYVPIICLFLLAVFEVRIEYWLFGMFYPTVFYIGVFENRHEVPIVYSVCMAMLSFLGNISSHGEIAATYSAICILATTFALISIPVLPVTTIRSATQPSYQTAFYAYYPIHLAVIGWCLAPIWSW